MPSRTSSDDAPGFLVAGGAHALGLVLLVWNFSHPPVLEPTIETIPVEMITTSDLNQITNGEKNAKPLEQPQRRADKVAELEDHKDMAPTPDATKDTPPEPTPEKTITDPGPAPEKPPEPVATVVPPPAPAPPPAAAPPAPPVPTPPEKPVETSEAKPEPPKADAPPVDAPLPPEKPVEKAEAAPKDEPKPPPPPDAEPVAPAPPPRPKVEVKKPEPPKHAKVEPKKPVPRPKPVKLAKLEPVAPPPPPPPPPQPQPKPDKLFDKVSSLLDRMKPDKPLDKVASLLDHLKPDPVRPVPVARPPEPVKVEAPKPVERPKSGNEVKEAKPRDDFSPDKIAAMLSHEAPQRKASTGHALAQVASLGSPTAHAEKLSPTMAAQLDGWLIDHYRGCWSYFGLGAAQDYVPTIRIHMAQDGSLIGQPAIVNPPRDPNLQSLADSAIRAVNKCNPLPIPERFRPYYDQGYRQRVVRFDPKEMS